MTESPRVICISRALGALGEVVGRTVSTELGFGYLDEEIVERAAEKLQVPSDLVADVEKRTPLMRRLLGEIAVDVASVSFVTGVTPPTALLNASDDYRALIQQVINDAAQDGDVVIVAHAASMALAGRADVLRVLITASPDVRAARLAEELELEPGAARKLVTDADRDRADYFKRFYKLDQELPTHYDLVVNTDAVAPADAARLVLVACGH